MNTEYRKTPDEILEERIDKLQRRREWKRFLTECIVLVAAIFIVFHYVIGITFVSGSSMEPALSDGDLVVFYRLDQEYQRDDIVVIHQGGNLEYIKRIAALSGESISLEEDGTETGEIPEGCYFVLGDNRENSRDSRSFGAVKKEEIVGRVFFRLGLTR